MAAAPFSAVSWTSAAVSDVRAAGAVAAAAAVRPAPADTLPSQDSCEALTGGAGSALPGTCCAVEDPAAMPAWPLLVPVWASCTLLLFGASLDSLASPVAAGSLDTELDGLRAVVCICSCDCCCPVPPAAAANPSPGKVSFDPKLCLGLSGA